MVRVAALISIRPGRGLVQEQLKTRWVGNHSAVDGGLGLCAADGGTFWNVLIRIVDHATCRLLRIGLTEFGVRIG